ncbi:MAG: hypothetical protein ACHP7H_00590 [Hyphomicrobiales bacterium]
MADVDGLCGPANLIIVAPPATTTIRGVALFVLSAPFASARFVFDASIDDWAVVAISSGGNQPGIDAVWVDVPAGSVLVPTAAQTFLSCDSTGAQTVINLPPAAGLFNGQIQLVKLTGATVTPVIVNAGVGTTIELLNASGTFGAQTYLTDQGQVVFFKYDASTTSWKAFSLYDGNAAAAQAQTAWQIDPQNVEGTSANTNKGNTVGTALTAWAEVIRRTKAVAWSIAASVTVTFLSSHINNSDPMVWNVTATNGAIATVQGAAPAATAAVFTLVSAKNRAAGANAALVGSFSAGAPAQGMLVQNTTALKSSRALIYKTAGGATWTLTQPFVPAALPLANHTAEVDTWASLDTVSLLAPVAIYIVALSGQQGGNSNNKVVNLYQCVVLAPDSPNDLCTLSLSVTIAEVYFQGRLTLGASSAIEPINFTNVGVLGFFDVYSGFTQFIGGFMVGTSEFGGAFTRFDGDTIMGGLTEFLGFVFVGFVFLDNTMFIQNGNANFATIFYGGHCIYGSAAADVQLYENTRVNLGSGTWTAGLTYPEAIAAGVMLNGARTGSSSTSTLGTITVFGPIATTVANLDAAAGVAGFGGTAFNLGGASLSLAA